jgi:hypothetical protein
MPLVTPYVGEGALRGLEYLDTVRRTAPATRGRRRGCS